MIKIPFKKTEIFTGVERRRSPRIEDNNPLILYSRGKDRVYPLKDISCGGLCFESSDENIPNETNLKAELKILDPQSKSTPALPAWLKIIWSKRTEKGYRVGAEFVQINDEDRAVIFKRIDQVVKRQRLWTLKKEFIVHGLLISAILAGALLFIFQYRTFSSIRNSLETALAYSEKERVRLRAAFESIIKEREALQIDLDNTKTLLTQTEGLLKTERGKFNSQLGSLKKEVDRLEDAVVGLSQKNLSLESRLHSLKELHLAIRAVKREAYLRRVKMQRKLDRIRLLYGNKGYVIKGSKSTLGTKGVIIRVLPAEIRGAPNYE